MTADNAAGHTPVPWKLSGVEHVYRQGINGANICSIGEPRATTEVGYTPLELGSKDFNEACANAEFIVRVANCHNDLVTALKNTLALLRLFTRETDEIAKACWDEAEAALAKAEG